MNPEKKRERAAEEAAQPGPPRPRDPGKPASPVEPQPESEPLDEESLDAVLREAPL